MGNGIRRNWQFFVESPNGSVKIICTKKCICPYRMAIWNDMQRWLNESPFADFEIEKIGYCIHPIENENAIRKVAKVN